MSRAKPPISNKLLGTGTVKFLSRSPPRRNARLRGFGCSIMQHLFVVPWLTPSRRTLRGITVVAILVFGFFAILKTTTDGTGSPSHDRSNDSDPITSPLPQLPP